MRKVTTLTMLMLAFAAIGTADAQVRDHRRATTERAPAIGRLAYGPDQCLYRFTGRGWSPLGLCHRWVQSNMAYLMMSSRPGVIHSVLHYADGRVVRVVDLISSREIWLNPDGTVKGARPITAASARIGAPPIEVDGHVPEGGAGCPDSNELPDAHGLYRDWKSLLDDRRRDAAGGTAAGGRDTRGVQRSDRAASFQDGSAAAGDVDERKHQSERRPPPRHRATRA